MDGDARVKDKHVNSGRGGWHGGAPRVASQRARGLLPPCCQQMNASPLCRRIFTGRLPPAPHS